MHRIEKDQLIINHYPGDKYPYYVQKVWLLDMGRFTTMKAAEEHLQFCMDNDIVY